MRASNSEEVSNHGKADPWEVFTQLVILVVEGRTPGGDKGYHAGPHCPQPHQPMGNRHICNLDAPVCTRAESLVKQLRLMWGVGVGVSVEVLLAPECEHGTSIATTLDTTSAPSPNLQLLEQWNFTIYDKKIPNATSCGWALVAAVRSFLHFSQLSAWLSSSGGVRPPNVVYRLTVSSPMFCSKFSAEPEQHHFPLASVGLETSIKVVVRTLPRINQIPNIKCKEIHCEVQYEYNPIRFLESHLLPESFLDTECVEVATSTKVEDPCRSEEDLRRCMMKAKLTETARVSRSESPDTQLGESLLDPPNSMSRVPRRFQSPSRSGSPSLETPEHLLCKIRQPGPSHARPPDKSPFCRPLVVPARQPLNPFPWTQTRYPSAQQAATPYPSQLATKVLQTNPNTDFNQQTNSPSSFSNVDHNRIQLNFPEGTNIHPYYHPPSQYYWPQVQNLSGHEVQARPQYIQSFQNASYNHNQAPVSIENFSVNNSERPCSSSRNLTDSQGDFSYSDYPFPPPTTSSYRSPKNHTIDSYIHSTANCSVAIPETQGTKRKGTNRTESPSKRESPPHVGRDLEGKWTAYRPTCQVPTSPLIDDQLAPCCTQPGKHFCESLEDLTDIRDMIQDSNKAIPKTSQEESSQPSGKLKQTQPKNNGFELTPKETREILSVLRQKTPVPPLRIPVHRTSVVQPSTESLLLFGKSFGKRIPTDEDSSCVCKKISRNDSSEMGLLQKSPLRTDGNSQIDGNNVSVKDVDKAHNVIENKPCTSSNNSCDTSFKKSSNSNKCKKLSRYKNGKEDNTKSSITKCRLDTLLKNAKNTDISMCVQAKTVTQKTNYFTATSRPVSESGNDRRQASRAIMRNPLSSVLSGIKRSSPELCEQDEKKNGEPTKVKRSLHFEDVKCDCKDPTLKASSSTKIILKSDSTISALHVERDARESFSLFKKLTSSPLYLSALEKSVPESIKVQSRCRVKDINENNVAELAQNGEKRNLSVSKKIENILGKRSKISPSIFSPEREDSGGEADKEVEDLCRTKGLPIPTVSDQVSFRRSLDSAANLVFHNKTGLPLTSSPAPMRKGHSFDYDSSLISVAAIKSALRPCEEEDEAEKSEKIIGTLDKYRYNLLSASAPATVTCSNLLGSFEESVLNGRLEPFSTVHGFKAEIAASGEFCPKHITKSVTVFFYTLCDNYKMSSPYMGHVNLAKKGYHIPSQGTVQVTLFNPHGTVVKMFVVMYDLSDMPRNSKTFLRQRTLNMPVGESDTHPDAHQWLRYLIHLRFASSKSGKIYLHTDIRMMIFRRCDVDAAVLHQTDVPYEVRSFTHGPSNPKFSPRK